MKQEGSETGRKRNRKEVKQKGRETGSEEKQERRETISNASDCHAVWNKSRNESVPLLLLIMMKSR